VNQTSVLRLPKTKELTTRYRSKKDRVPIQKIHKPGRTSLSFQRHMAKPITAHKTWPRLVLSAKFSEDRIIALPKAHLSWHKCSDIVAKGNGVASNICSYLRIKMG